MGGDGLFQGGIVAAHSNNPFDFDNDPKFDFGNPTAFAAQSAIPQGPEVALSDPSLQTPLGSDIPIEATDSGVPVQFETEISGPHHDGFLVFDISVAWSDGDS
jgi:hypothetical protein